jgi:GxxExxY protein
VQSEKVIQKVKEIILDVYETLGSGHSEFVYESAIEVGLRLAKIPYENQRTVPIYYKGYYVGYGCPDIIVKQGGDIVVEIKAITKLGRKEETQVRTYMKALNITVGLLVNMQAPGYDLEKETAVEIRELYQ